MLEVDNRVIVPEETHIRFIITSGDVIHSFASSSLGLKCDAYPGRLNQVSAYINREGVFYGQCSEICGILHSSMPIVVVSVSLEKFITNLTLVIFLIGILGFVFNRKNIILMLISIEIMLLSITFLILVSSINIDDIIGQTYAIYIIVIAGAESAIGLGILVAFYRLRGSIAIEYK